MVPTVVPNPYCLSSLGFEFYYSIKKQKKSVDLDFDFKIELKVRFACQSLIKEVDIVLRDVYLG